MRGIVVPAQRLERPREELVLGHAAAGAPGAPLVAALRRARRGRRAGVVPDADDAPRAVERDERRLRVRPGLLLRTRVEAPLVLAQLPLEARGELLEGQGALGGEEARGDARRDRLDLVLRGAVRARAVGGVRGRRLHRAPEGRIQRRARRRRGPSYVHRRVAARHGAGPDVERDPISRF